MTIEWIDMFLGKSRFNPSPRDPHWDNDTFSHWAWTHVTHWAEIEGPSS